MITTDELDRIKALAQALKEQGVNFDDYLANGCLFAEMELTEGQREALRALGVRVSGRRSPEPTGQPRLFD